MPSGVHGGGGASMEQARRECEKAVKNRKVFGPKDAPQQSIFAGNPKFAPSGHEGDGAEVQIIGSKESGGGDGEEEPADKEDDPAPAAQPNPPPADEASAQDVDGEGGQLSEKQMRKIVRDEMSASTPEQPEPDPKQPAVLPDWAEACRQNLDEARLARLRMVTSHMLDVLASDPIPVMWHTEDGIEQTAFDIVEFYGHATDPALARVILKSRPGRKVVVPDPGLELQCSIDGKLYTARLAGNNPQTDAWGWSRISMLALDEDAVEGEHEERRHGGKTSVIG